MVSTEVRFRTGRVLNISVLIEKTGEANWYLGCVNPPHDIKTAKGNIKGVSEIKLTNSGLYSFFLIKSKIESAIKASGMAM